MELPDELHESIVEYIEDHPIKMYWDRNDKLSKDQLVDLIQAENPDEILGDIKEKLFDYNRNYMADREDDFLRETVFSQFEGRLIDAVRPEYPDKPRESLRETIQGLIEKEYKGHVTIDMNIDELLSRSNGKEITLRTGVTARPGLDPNNIQYEDVEDLLEVLSVNPASLPLDVAESFPGCPGRDDKEIITPEDASELLINTTVRAEHELVALLEVDLKNFAHNPDDYKPPFKLRKGTGITLYDYRNGAGSMIEELQRDVVIDHDDAHLYHDGSDSYGVQSCYGLSRSAWNGQVEPVDSLTDEQQPTGLSR